MATQNIREDAFIRRAHELLETNMKDEGFGVSELADEMSMS